MRSFLFQILFFSFTTLLSAQEVSFRAEPSRKSLGENERLRVDFIMNREGDNFTPPSFENFEYSGPTQSVSNSWINGVRSFSKTYTYMLQPKKKGKLTIGAASVIIEGKEYKTKPLTIEVTDPVANPRSAQTTPPTSPFGNNSPFGNFPFGFDPFGTEEVQPMEIIEPTKEDLFITAEVSSNHVFVNQPVTITYKMYLSARFGIAGFESIEDPRYANFWSQQLLDKLQVTEVVHNGKPFRCITLKQVLLYPQQSGEQEISPLSTSFVLQLPSNQVDFFGNRSYVTRSRRLQSNALKIKVSPFPEVIISGKGNFKLFDMPKLTFPPALEVYAPKEEEHLNHSAMGVSGDITHTYTIVPQYKGKFPIAPLSFTFFDPETQKYETLTSDPFTIEVPNGEEYNATSPENTSEVAQEKGQFAPLKTEAQLAPINRAVFFGSGLFYLLWLLPIVLIPIVLLLRYFYQKRNDDTAENRSRRTNRLAKKYLSAAKKNIHNKELFYESMERGLHTYLKAKLHIETSELSKDKVRELLEEKQVESSAIARFLQLLSNCEMARYAPYTQADIDNDYEQAASIIALLDKQL